MVCSDKDIAFMELEARLDRLQVALRKIDNPLAIQAQKCLGVTRSIMRYREVRPQKTLKAFGVLTVLEQRTTHHAKQIGSED